ncbi:MAG: cell division protein FtsA [Proteobacteria bacterium]|jgi:cell division protein FtsA|nr:cell division protein FtsA [Pseudomonadota bacterium]
MIKQKEEKKLIVALDIGTSKIVTIVSEIKADGDIQILGIGQHVSRGLKKGVVVNIESTMQAIQRSLEEAELMADCKIKEVYTGIAGSHIRSINSTGMIKIRDLEVDNSDVERVIETAQAITLPPDQQVLHTLVQEYIIDDQHDIKEPRGMSGMRLEVKVHIVSGAIAAAQNIVKCIKRSGLDVMELILQPLASADAVLTNDEKELGVCLIDIGGGTTDIIVFKDGSVKHTAVIPIAGDQITNDISVAFRTPQQSAEEIKINYGSCDISKSNSQEFIDVPLVDGRSPKKINAKELASIIEPRVKELFELVTNELIRSKLINKIASGIVITGGSSLIKNITDIAEKNFNQSVRIGYPQGVDGLRQIIENPRYATAIGLIKRGKVDYENDQRRKIQGNSLMQILEKMKLWFQGNF